jgi:branched-chain amino acid transport system substrate-binding protein
MQYGTRSEATERRSQFETNRLTDRYREYVQSLRSWFRTAWRPLLLLPALLPLLPFGLPIRATENEPIKVGVFLSLTGATAAYGVSSLNSFKLATDELNAAGGIHGRKLELVVEDDHSNSQDVSGVVTKLINEDKVAALLGEPVSTRALIAAPIAQKHKVVMISPASIKPEVTMQGDYIFRACFISPVEAQAVANFAVKKLKAKRAAIVLDGKNDYAVVLAGFFAEYFKKLSGEIVSQQIYEATDKDISQQMATINSVKPDVIFAPGFYTTAGLVVREFKRQSSKATLIGSDGWDSPSLLEDSNGVFEGVYFAGHFWIGSKDAVVQKFVSDYTKRYGVAPDALAATSYDAARMLFAAMQSARSTEPTAIRDALAKTSKFHGVTGQITLDANRNANAPVYLLRIEKGGFSLSDMLLSTSDH